MGRESEHRTGQRRRDSNGVMDANRGTVLPIASRSPAFCSLCWGVRF